MLATSTAGARTGKSPTFVSRVISGRPDTQTATSVDVPPMSNVRMRSKPAWDATNDAPLTPPAGPDSTVCTGLLQAELKAHQAAVRPHDLDRRPHVRGCKTVADVRQVPLEDRRDVRVHQRRHRALVLAELGQDLRGDRHRQVGRDGGGDVRDDALVAAVGMRVEQADGQGLHPVGDELLDGGTHGRRVDRLDDRPIGACSLGHLADVAGVGQRLGLLVDHEPEQRPRRPRLGEVQDLAEAFRHDQADERTAALEDGVRRDGGAVEDRVEVG